MTDFEPDSDHSPDEKPDDKDSSRKLELSGVQVAASALAAISSAVAASFLGVGGTVLGAGLGSVIATISTALYQHSLHRTNATLKKVVPVPNVVVRQTAGRLRAPADPADVPEIRTDGSIALPVPADDRSRPAAAPADRRPLRWGRLALAAAVVFGVALGSIAVVETFLGGSVSSVVRGEDPHGSTIGGLVNNDDKGGSKPDSPTSPTPDPSGTPDPGTPPDDETPAPTPSASEDPVTPEPTEVAPDQPSVGGESSPPGAGSDLPGSGAGSATPAP
jgi:hypothetical protein